MEPCFYTWVCVLSSPAQTHTLMQYNGSKLFVAECELVTLMCQEAKLCFNKAKDDWKTCAGFKITGMNLGHSNI